MMTAEQNYRLLLEIDANRCFLLLAYRDNPALLARAEENIRMLFAAPSVMTPPDTVPTTGNCGEK